MVGAHRGVGWIGVWTQRASVLVGFSVALSDPTRGMDCEAANRSGTTDLIVAVCQRQYEQTRDPRVGILLANALRASDEWDAAAAIARGLLTTSEKADAFQILGKALISQERPDDAITALTTARTLHREQGKRAEVARDAQALARVLTERQQFSEALIALDECIVESKAAAGGAEMELYCHLSASRVLAQVGYFELAQRELDRAAPSARTDRDRASLEVERGNLDQEVARIPLRHGYNEQAVVAFENALVLATRARLTRLVTVIEMNLAYSLGEVGKHDDAEAHLESATRLDVHGNFAVARQVLAGRIAYLRGNLSLAAQLNDQAYPKIEDDDERLDTATLQARIAIRNGDARKAELWARRGVEEVEKIRSQQSALELRSWVLSTRRAPYEVLFAVLARAKRDEEALLVFNRWQGRTLLDAMARPSSNPSADLKGAAKQVERIGAWLPVISTAPIVKGGDDRAALDQLATIDVLAFAVADRSVFIIAARAGKIEIRELGSYDELAVQLDRFIGRPTEATSATTLGEKLVPEALFTKTDRTLHVLLDGPLSSLPIGALRRGGVPLIAMRPVVRVLRLPDRPCTPTRAVKRATILADATSDLPAARGEAEEVAAMLPDARLAIGKAATRRVLFETERDAALHVAVHAELDTGGGTLRLADQSVSALEISASKLGPPVVMLSACGTANASDAELANSLATAFLVSGSQLVIGTLRPVSDAGSRELSTQFYREGGINDPPRVLARIQARLAETTNTDWPSFVVFGNNVCSTPGE
jgi:tetratricopeptide (TPR) repeat protein